MLVFVRRLLNTRARVAYKVSVSITRRMEKTEQTPAKYPTRVNMFEG